MNILVTGCAGFIGNKVSEILLNDGNQIFGIDNLNSSYDISLKKYRLNNFFIFLSSLINNIGSLCGRRSIISCLLNLSFIFIIFN